MSRLLWMPATRGMPTRASIGPTRRTILGLKAGYKFRRWLTLGAEYAHTNRDSNIDTFDYDKNFYLLSLTASM